MRTESGLLLVGGGHHTNVDNIFNLSLIRQGRGSVSEWLLGSFVLILYSSTKPIFTNTEMAIMSTLWYIALVAG